MATRRSAIGRPSILLLVAVALSGCYGGSVPGPQVDSNPGPGIHDADEDRPQGAPDTFVLADGNADDRGLGADATPGGGGGTGGSAGPMDAGMGGAIATGGMTATGGAISTGGVAATGGVVGSGGGAGGAPAGTGGSTAAVATGGVQGTGGMLGTGGAFNAECSPGAHSCSGDALLTCDANGRWPATGAPCSFVCRNNVCSGQCKPGTRSCSGDTLLTCDANGIWPSTGTACTYVCRNNTCAGQCKPSTTMCDQNTQLTCDADGNWPATGTACPYVCRNDACAGQCKPGDHSCNSNTLLTCDVNGSWPTAGMTCGTGYTCSVSKGSCQCALTQCTDGRCLDTTSDPMNCGTCDHACPGQCNGGVCNCTPPSSSNLVSDGGFDGSASVWTQQSYSNFAITRAPLDSANCASSGSLLCKYTGTTAGNTGNVFGSCVPVGAGTSYNMGAWLYFPSAGGNQGTGTFGMGWYGSADCAITSALRDANGSIAGPYKFGNNSVYDTWQYVHDEGIVPPAGAVAAKPFVAVSAGVAGGTGQVYFDSFYFTPAPGRF